MFKRFELIWWKWDPVIFTSGILSSINKCEYTVTCFVWQLAFYGTNVPKSISIHVYFMAQPPYATYDTILSNN